MSHGKMVAKTTSRGGESMGSGALPNCLYFRFFRQNGGGMYPWFRFSVHIHVLHSPSLIAYTTLT